MMSPNPNIKAIIFDIGGVVVGSPLFAINAYEKDHGLPFQYLNVAITAQGHGGAFQRFERNELDLYSFYRQFGHELSNVEANNRHYTAFCKARGMDVPALPKELKIDGRDLFGQMMRRSLQVDPKMSHAIQKLRATGRYKIAALTNNFAPPTAPSTPAGERGASGPAPSLEEELDHLGLGAKQDGVKNLFDEYIESAKVGMRKPDPNFYRYALDLLKVEPSQTVFLDDIGHNLKAAKDLGIFTIRVNSKDSTDALRQLSKVTGLELLPDRQGAKL
ncbi:uncharacterized protein PFL1_05218 [Pseudozyma flocculosa PF-1]|uniref:Related to epoxide hydrolase n=2 Tax=Pseudozyma flocculosa TaxID=84751 RepID=A0A5C3F6L4_9BASI|nr:uncharacterized protein PFL1_05218 [Pseudozyma flocculosa PF-1]EPQ27295.1 hypothetical protein PFL1_05218 [Pseudozyma flocculosa PF-1]SPO39666.1 related to epoxide hydrolase [Pseudozyma flocculosa]